MQFEWNKSKNESNKKKHGLSFEIASFVFEDPFLLSLHDDRHDYSEERWQSLGLIQETLIYVVHTVEEDKNGEEIIRIISARAATSSETRRYYVNRRNDKRT